MAAPVPRQVISHSLSLTLDLSQLVCGVPPPPEGPSDWLSVSTTALAAPRGSCLLGASVEPADPLRIPVIEEQADTAVQPSNLRHLLIGELEVEDIHVLAHSLAPDGLGDDDHPALGEPPKNDLPNGLGVFSADAREDEVAEEVVLAFRERTPGFDFESMGAGIRNFDAGGFEVLRNAGLLSAGRDGGFGHGGIICGAS